MGRKAKFLYKPHEIPKKWLQIINLLPNFNPLALSKGCFFAPKAAQRVIDFFEKQLEHVEGRSAGKPFLLGTWQKSYLANLFGWKKVDDYGETVRRFRQSYLQVARKNGKTPLVAGIGVYVLFCDNEKAAQGYISASSREQAGMLFRHVRGFVENNESLNSLARVYGGKAEAGQSRSVMLYEDGSYLRVISPEGKSAHGQNPHLVIIDELHTQSDRELVDTLESGFVSEMRSQPLMIFLTTRDEDRPSICNAKRDYALAVCANDGDVSKPGYDPDFLPAVYELDEEDLTDDNWKNPSCWLKLTQI